MAQTADYRVAFEYDSAWLAKGFSISPLSLPLEKGVFAHNRDDHSKNFSFLYDKEKWKLSPAYDLTYSNSIAGEHATTVDGNGRNPGLEEVLAVAKRIKFDKRKAVKIATEIQEFVLEELGVYIQ